MPTLDQWNTSSIKSLHVGRPGAGKTGALIEILIAYPNARMFIANFDRGNFGTLANVARFDPVKKTARDPALVASLLSRVHYRNFEDDIQVVNGVPMIVGNPKAFREVGDALNNWGDGLGGLDQWGPDDWFVYDSISAFCTAGMRQALHNAQRLNKRPQIEDWGEAIARVSLLLEKTNASQLKCNVIANTHVRFVGDVEAGKDQKNQFNEMDMVPNALGQQLPNEIGRYFNNILEFREVGEGVGSQRKIFTVSPGKLTTRSSNPAMVKPDYPINGLGQWVRDLRTAPPPVAATPPPPAAPAASTPSAPPATAS